MRQRRLLFGAVAILLLVAFAAGMYLSWQRLAGANGSAPDETAAVEKLLTASFTDPAGRKTTLSQLGGKPLIVNFWATWCPPCLKEMPLFSSLQEKYPNIQFIGIAADSAENVQAFVVKHNVAYPILIAGGDVMSLMAELGNHRNGLPFTISIDTSGHPRNSKLGALSESEAERIVADLSGS